MKTVLFAGPRLFMKFADLEYFRGRAAEEGLEILQARATDEAAFAREAARVHALSVIDYPVGRAVVSALERCELIQTLSVGYDCVDVEAATERRIPVSNTPAYCTHEVASHALTLLLAVTRRLAEILPRTREGVWDYNHARPIPALRGRTLGIVGFGRIGRALAPMARAIGMETAAYDPYQPDDLFRLLDVRRMHDLEDLLRAADVLSVHANLTPETEGMIGEPELRCLRPGAVLINTARGRILDEAAVLRAVGSGRLAGAGVDVLSVEPPPRDHPFLRADRIVVTPHLAWYSEQSLRECMVQGMDEIVRVLAGRRPRYVVNPQVFRRAVL